MFSERSTPVGWSIGLLRRTGVAIHGALGRSDGRAILVVVTVAYFALYAVGLQHLGLGVWRVELSIVENPLLRATRQIAPFQYEPIALIVFGPIEYLFAPVNALVGLFLGVLVGVNLAVSYVAWRGPRACRIGAGAGVAAGLPGLLSGVVCCGPAILLVIGVQASASLLAAFRWFLPIAVLLLVGTLLWIGSHVEIDRT